MDFLIETVCEKFPSRLMEVAKLESLFSGIRDHIPGGDKKYFEIMVAITEAFNNAIKHGNQFDPHKFVALKAGISNELLWCRIGDQGKGFEMGDIPDPLSAENLMKESGRGIFLIKKLSTGCNFSQTKYGYQVDMVFWLGNQETEDNLS